MKDAPAPVTSLANAGERVEAASSTAATQVLNEGFTRDDSIAGWKGRAPSRRIRRGALHRRGGAARGQRSDAGMAARPLAPRRAAGHAAARVIWLSSGCRTPVRSGPQAALA